jgi:hypothetical protein
MLGKSPSRLPVAVVKRPRASHVYPAHHSLHLIPDQLLPWLFAAALVFGLAMLTLALTARGDTTTNRGGAAVLPQLPSNANDFARDFFHHEVEAQTQDHSLWRYHETKREAGKLRTYDVWQTRQGEVQRLIEIDGHPLSEQDLATEDSRIEDMISDPEQVHQQQKQEHEDGEQARKLMRMFPDAFNFQYDGQHNGAQGDVVRLRFSPNPKFRPPDHAAQVFHHMEGTVLVDAQQKRLAAINGTLTSEVKFFGGLFGYLAKGGTFHVEQKEVGPQIWEVTVMHVHMSGKALLFKTIDVQEDETYSDFHSVPADTSLKQAAQQLKDGAPSMQAAAQNSTSGLRKHFPQPSPLSRF